MKTLSTKAILVVDMPSNCKSCMFCGFGGMYNELNVCMITGSNGTEEKLDWCPLKPMPEPKDIGYPNDNYDVGFADGWDACLKEIEK